MVLYLISLFIVLVTALIVILMRRRKVESSHYVVELKENIDHQVWLSLLEKLTKFMKENRYNLEDFGADKIDWNGYWELSKQGKLTFFEGFVTTSGEEKPERGWKQLMREFLGSQNVEVKDIHN